jgi:hypothetical protein
MSFAINEGTLQRMLNEMPTARVGTWPKRATTDGLSERRGSCLFKAAADRWTKVITGDLPSVLINGDRVDDLLILAQGQAIDGPAGSSARLYG